MSDTKIEMMRGYKMVPPAPHDHWVEVAPEPAQANMYQVGEVYRFKGLPGPPQPEGEPASVQGRRWYCPPGNYRLLGLAQDIHTLQMKVVYVGVDAGTPEEGRMLVTTVADWERMFGPSSRKAARI
jgi:hypothetical protein